MPGGTDQTLRPFLWRAVNLSPDREIVSRTGHGVNRYTYREYDERTAQLAHALTEYGITHGDRVATFCWNHHRHLETYFAVPTIGAQLHTINPLLPDEHIQYIVEDAEDELIFVDESLAPKLAGAATDASEFSGVDFVVMGESSVDAIDATPYEEFIAGRPTEYEWPLLDEDQPAGMCYTSGTTGNPKGVEYTHQMLWSHTMTVLTPQGIPIAADDVVMPVVPMFHVNAWGLPFAATAGGAKHVYPGPSPEPADIARLLEEEAVTLTAGVPTVWLGLMEYMEEHDVDLSALERVVVGGSAAPESMIRWFDDHDVELLHAWGMTEMSPIGSVSHLKPTLEDSAYETQLNHRLKQGLLVPGVEMRVVAEDGSEVAWDGEEFGELWVRGPAVTQEYFKRPDATDEDFEDPDRRDAPGSPTGEGASGRWLKTGDVVTVDEEGYIQIVDRSKDVIKSGGEWISSVELENAIMSHADVAEAAVVGVPHDRWQERPVAFVVPTDRADTATLEDEIMADLADEYPKWWLPDAVEYIEEIPKTATGKFSKKDIRSQYSDASLVEGRVPEEAAPDTE